MSLKEPVQAMETEQQWLAQQQSPLCQCKAHSCQDAVMYEALSSLAIIQLPLNDDTGSQMANVLLPYTCIMKAAGLNLSIHGTGRGQLEV